MKLFLDTADLADIRWASRAGLIDGVTTNPSLLSQSAGDVEPRDVLKEICSLVDGPVSAEVVAVDGDGMYHEGRELAKIAENIVVKIPMIEDGLPVIRRLAGEGIRVNVTLCFSANQALLAAKAGASFISPRQVRDQIDAFIAAYNQDAHPFAWTKQVVFAKHPRSKYADLRN